MGHIRRFLQTRWDVLLLASVVGSLVIAPSLYFRNSGAYAGVEMFRADAELNYLAQIQEVQDGHYSLGNIYTADGKDAPHAIQQPLAALAMGLPGKALGLTAAV